MLYLLLKLCDAPKNSYFCRIECLEIFDCILEVINRGVDRLTQGLRSPVQRSIIDRIEPQDFIQAGESVIPVLGLHQAGRDVQKHCKLVL